MYSVLKTAAAVIGASLLTVSATDECVTKDQPNPIAKDYPFVVSGSLNGTTMIIPITMTAARAVIPKKYGILEGAWKHLLPDFPDDMYPMMAVAVHDHDLILSSLGIKVPDFMRTSLEFPFVDLLNDGYSSFRWGATNMIEDGSPAILGATVGFGIKVYAADFEPECDPYETSYNDVRKLSATATHHARSMHITAKPSHDVVPYPLDFIKNITNQPTFANPLICDNYKRLFNTSLSESPYDPVPVKGSVAAKLEPFEDGEAWDGVYGWQLSTAFLEPPIGSPCFLLKGYRGTGPGDSTEF